VFDIASFLIFIKIALSSKTASQRSLQIKDASNVSTEKDILHNSNLFHSSFASETAVITNLVDTNNLKHNKDIRLAK
jgi:hypothetical protein